MAIDRINISTVSDDQNTSTGALDIPVGTTAQRPGSPTSGNIRYNTTISGAELYNGTAWERVDKLVPTITSITGNIYDGVAAAALTVRGLNFLTGAGTFNFTDSANNVNENVAVTPTSDILMTVSVPAAVYNNSGAGSEVLVKFTNSEGTVGASFSMTVVGFPTGGTIVTSGNYRYHTFTSTGNFSTPAGWNNPVEYLMIAGGGGGGNDLAGAGGAGGLLNGPTSALSAGADYPMVIGTGGAGGTGGRGSSTSDGTNGVDSTGFSLTAVGGGKGGSYWDGGATASRSAGGDGGSGGGGSGVGASANPNPAPGGSATSGQGNNGGAGLVYPSPGSANYQGGGGGGAGAVGAAGASDGSGGTGGAGSSAYSAWGTATSTGENISGTRWFAGGGGGGRYNHTGDGRAPGGNGGGGQGGMGTGTAASNQGEDATDGTGGGGGGGTWTGSAASLGGDGGDGIIIVRYNLTTLG